MTRSIELSDRRRALALIGGTAIAVPMLGLAGCGGGEKEVGAVEDLMREHGVLRRALLVYVAAIDTLRDHRPLPPKPLADTAQLFRSFGEDYHERQLEEAHIFPIVKNAKPELATLVDTLKAQHERGREITDYILKTCARPDFSTQAQPLASALDGFVRMYQNHTAREDTVLFVAWKSALSAHQLHEYGEQFEGIEKKTFGHDGFDDAVQKIGAVEQQLGLADLAQFTAPAAPAKA